MLGQYESLIAATLWLADDNGILRGTPDERAAVFRSYLNCLAVSPFHPIPRGFAREMLELKLKGLLSLSADEAACITWNAGRETAAREWDKELQAARTRQAEEKRVGGLRLVANPSTSSKPKPKAKQRDK